MTGNSQRRQFNLSLSISCLTVFLWHAHRTLSCVSSRSTAMDEMDLPRELADNDLTKPPGRIEQAH